MVNRVGGWHGRPSRSLSGLRVRARACVCACVCAQVKMAMSQQLRLLTAARERKSCSWHVARLSHCSSRYYERHLFLSPFLRRVASAIDYCQPLIGSSIIPGCWNNWQAFPRSSFSLSFSLLLHVLSRVKSEHRNRRYFYGATTIERAKLKS